MRTPTAILRNTVQEHREHDLRAGQIRLEYRGLNESVYGEAKQFAALDYIPCRRRVANEIFTLSTMLAHNLGRELQMQATQPTRRTSRTREPQHELETLGTLAHLLIRQAGRLTRPQGALHLTTAASGIARREFEAIYEALAA